MSDELNSCHLERLKEASNNNISVCRDSLWIWKTHTCLSYLLGRNVKDYFKCGTLVEVYFKLRDIYCISDLKHQVSRVGKVLLQDSSDLQTLTQISEQGYYLTPPHRETCKHSVARGPNRDAHTVTHTNTGALMMLLMSTRKRTHLWRQLMMLIIEISHWYSCWKTSVNKLVLACVDCVNCASTCRVLFNIYLFSTGFFESYILSCCVELVLIVC